MKRTAPPVRRAQAFLLNAGIPVLLFSLTVFLGFSSCSASQDADWTAPALARDFSPGPGYAHTAWPALHRDSRNSDFSPFYAVPDLELAWYALDGASILGGPHIGPDGKLYVTTGQGGGTASLHVFYPDGRSAWESADFEAGILINPPVSDPDGNIYFADGRSFYSLDSGGKTRWEIAFADAGVTGNFITAQFVGESLVGGITTDGQVLLVDKNSGSVHGSPLDLPGEKGPPSEPVPAGVLGGGLVDPDYIRPLWDLFFGREIEVANTPAVHPGTGRIYIIAAGRNESSGSLYGIDVTPEGAVIAFETSVGPGSGTSPALSPDGRLVYAADDGGTMYAFDSKDGSVVWEVSGIDAVASPSVGQNGTVFTYTNKKKGTIIALNGRSGEILWKRDYSDLVRKSVPAAPPLVRSNSVDCVLVTTPGILWAALDYGYRIKAKGRIANIPYSNVLVALNPSDGSLLHEVPLRSSSSALIVPDHRGNVFVSMGAVPDSAFYYGEAAERLPKKLKMKQAPPAGLAAFRPSDPESWARGALEWTHGNIACAAEASLRDSVGMIRTIELQLKGVAEGRNGRYAGIALRALPAAEQAEAAALAGNASGVSRHLSELERLLGDLPGEK